MAHYVDDRSRTFRKENPDGVKTATAAINAAIFCPFLSLAALTVLVDLQLSARKSLSLFFLLSFFSFASFSV